MELPSSVAVATRGTVRPDLTGSSVNCGMALIALDSDDPDPRAIDALHARRPRALPLPDQGSQGAERRRGPSGRRARCRVRRASGGSTPYEDLERIEEGGRVDLEQYGGMDRLRRRAAQDSRSSSPGSGSGRSGRATTSSSSSASRRSWTRRRAARLGVREGQLTVQYHGGGGVLAGEIGRLFTRRKDYPRQIKAVNLALKPLVPPAHGALLEPAPPATQPVLHRRLPAGGPRERRGQAADAGQRGRDELRLRLPCLDLRLAPQPGRRVLRWSHAVGSSWTRRTTASTRSRSGRAPASSTGTTRAAPGRRT